MTYAEAAEMISVVSTRYPDKITGKTLEIFNTVTSMLRDERGEERNILYLVSYIDAYEEMLSTVIQMHKAGVLSEKEAEAFNTALTFLKRKGNIFSIYEINRVFKDIPRKEPWDAAFIFVEIFKRLDTLNSHCTYNKDLDEYTYYSHNSDDAKLILSLKNNEIYYCVNNERNRVTRRHLMYIWPGRKIL